MIKPKINQGRLIDNVNKDPISALDSAGTTHRLNSSNLANIIASRTFGYRLILAIFLIAGLCLFYFTLFGAPVYRGNAPPFSGANDMGDLLCFTLSMLFSVGGFGCFFSGKSPFRIDAVTKKVYVYDHDSCGLITHGFDDLHGLQLLQKTVRDSDGDYTCYELNLVFNNAARVNLLSHGGRALIKRDAEKLARILRRPLYHHVAQGKKQGHEYVCN